MLCEYLLMYLAIGVTTASGLDAVVFHNNRPVALCDAETAKCFKILLAGDKCSGSILSNRSREAISGNNEIATLIELRHYIHGQDDGPFRLALIGNGKIGCGSLPGGERLITVTLTAS